MGDLKTGSSNPWFNKTKVDQIKGITPTPTVSTPPKTQPTTTSTTTTTTSKTSTPPKSVVSDQEQTQLETGLTKTSSTGLVKKSIGIPRPQKLEQVSKPSEPTFSRCSVDFPKDLEVYPSPTGPEVPMISNRVLKGLVKDGEINITELMKLVPEDCDNLFESSRSISEGSKFQFISEDYRGNERRIEVKFHSPDDGAYNRFGHCNSGDFWTAQIWVEGRLLNTSGELQYRSENQTHIPVLFGPKSK